MNKAVQFMNTWSKFDDQYPDAGLDDFCRHYLAHQKPAPIEIKFPDGMKPPNPNIILAKLIGRLYKLNTFYAEMALKETGFNSLEEFLLLNSIFFAKAPKKTEIIYQNFIELSTGLLMINKLIAAGYVSEFDDELDKRSKRLKLTQTGGEFVNTGRTRLHKVHEMFFATVAEDDIKVCAQMLGGIDLKFTNQYVDHKNRPFEEVYEEIMKDHQLQKENFIS